MIGCIVGCRITSPNIASAACQYGYGHIPPRENMSSAKKRQARRGGGVSTAAAELIADLRPDDGIRRKKRS